MGAARTPLRSQSSPPRLTFSPQLRRFSSRFAPWSPPLHSAKLPGNPCPTPFVTGPALVSASTEPLDLEDLRHFLTALAEAHGLSPARAVALARLLLWHDTAALPSFGAASLPDWLDRLQNELDPRSEGLILSEHPATAEIDAQRGLGPLILVRAAEIAVQKAREIGVGLVRVRNLGPQPVALFLAAELAIGPRLGLVLGPRGTWALGVPTAGGLPLVLGSDLGSSPHGLPALSRPLSLLLAPEPDWLVQAVSVPAFEPIEALHDRVSHWLAGNGSTPHLDPSEWDQRLTSARDRGLTLDRSAWEALSRLAARLNIPRPSPRTASSVPQDA